MIGSTLDAFQMIRIQGDMGKIFQSQTVFLTDGKRLFLRIKDLNDEGINLEVNVDNGTFRIVTF